MGSRWIWRLVALPGVVWLSVFFLCAFYAVLAVAFGNQDTLSQPVPHWNPLDTALRSTSYSSILDTTTVHLHVCVD